MGHGLPILFSCRRLLREAVGAKGFEGAGYNGFHAGDERSGKTVLPVTFNLVATFFEHGGHGQIEAGAVGVAEGMVVPAPGYSPEIEKPSIVDGWQDSEKSKQIGPPSRSSKRHTGSLS